MATLRKHRKLWYVRVRWYDKNNPYQKEKSEVFSNIKYQNR